MDRSPTGSGVTARVALQYHKGLIKLNQSRTFQSGATGSQFTGKAVEVPEFTSVISKMSLTRFDVCRSSVGQSVQGQGSKVSPRAQTQRRGKH